MGLKSIEVVTTCKLHGPVTDVVELGSTRYCGACLRGILERAVVTMETRENLDETETMTCRHCGGERHIDDRPCAVCGGEP